MHRLVLEQRTLGFTKFARRVTHDPVWDVVPLLRQHSPPLRGIPPDEWARWSPVVFAPSLQRAVDRCHTARHIPSWVALALASHKIASPSDAQLALYDVALRSRSHAFSLLVLTTHALAYFSLVALLRPLTAHLACIPHPYPSFHFNMLLQAISLFDRSRVAANVAVDLLRDMEHRGLALWSDTERVLIRDNFRTPQLLDHFRRRGASNLEARLRAYASLGRVQTSAHYLHAIQSQCLKAGTTPPYTADGTGSAHKANTHYLRSMRDDRPSAFRYFHHLLKLDLATPPTSHTANKSNIDIYDWTTALYAAAHDRALSPSALLGLFRATQQGTHAYKPTRATYTVVIQGLLWRNALDDAQKLWDEFVGEVVSARDKRDENPTRIDRKALCVGIDVLVQSGRTEEALCLLDEAIKRDTEEPNAPQPIRASPYLKVHPIHALFTALLRVRRPDAIFYIWTHLPSLYFVPPTNLMLRILLKAAIQASKMDAETFKGAMSWYIADNRLFKSQGGPIAPTIASYKAIQDCDPGKGPSPSDHDPGDGSRETLVVRLHALLQTPTPPTVVGIWANRRSTEVARSIFRGMIFGNWPPLRAAAGSGVTSARANGGEGVFQELARVLGGRPDRFLPPHQTHIGMARPTMARPGVGDEQLGPPLPTVIPSESTFAAYISLLGLSSRANEIPEVLVWMRALGVLPKTETLAIALVFWMEVGLRGPVFEDGWTRTSGRVQAGDGSVETASTEYGALRAWIRAWVGEKRAPREEDVYAGIKRVKEMRDGPFGKRGART